ncbi:hypothetical protein TWF281_006319 [Arthrobotrys megalospora]
MVFDGPYPSYSDSMERVIHDALSSPNHEDLDDILSASPSVHKSNFKFPRYIRTWLRSQPILKRLRSFKNQPENASIASCSSVSLLSTAADDILGRLPEGGSSIGKLVQSIQNMEKCFTPSAAEDTDSATETSCMSPCGSLLGSPGSGGAQEIRNTPVRFPGAVRRLGSGMKGYSKSRDREKKASKLKERYLEVHDGIWDSAAGVFIPNAWPAPGFAAKTAISKPKISRKGNR